MRTTDLPHLAARLTEMAEYFEKRPPGEKALRIWLDALEECAIADVLAVLVDWPKAHRAMPLAAEVLALCRARVSDRVEVEAKRSLESAPSLGGLLHGLSRQTTAEAKRARREIATLMSGAGRRDPKAWARKLKAREEAGDALSLLQRKEWRAALGDAETEAEREARLEREAIDAESFA